MGAPKNFLIIPALSLCLLCAQALQAKDNPLVGSWERDGAPYAELRADGSGSIEGKPVSWSAMGRMLFIVYPDGSADTAAYALEGDSLSLVVNGQAMSFSRASKAPAKAQAKEKGKEKAKTKGKAAGNPLSALLTSSAWCSFSYNQYSGVSHQERVVFAGDGTWASGSRGESYSSGPNGTVAGQSDSGDGGRWEVRGERLFLSAGGAPLEDAGLSVSRNSNGFPILRSGGKEYAQCR